MHGDCAIILSEIQLLLKRAFLVAKFHLIDDVTTTPQQLTQLLTRKEYAIPTL
ncbi:hypothetical protein DP20_2771 [Shigella flexneri]|nr:hypothetical protein DP20_2771 [Shigella flexneri]